MHILIAPNAFKNSLTATAAAEAIQDGLLQSDLDCSCEIFPIGDGGDGTVELIMKRCNGVICQAETVDPIGRSIISTYGLINNEEVCLIEMADASGLRLLKINEQQPLIATSYGTGLVIKAALDKGIRKFILGMGGTATVDGGCGILIALGIRFLDAKGEQLTGLPQSLTQLATIDFSGVDKRITDSELTILCDVDNKLLGEMGAAAVFGPQKGASKTDVQMLEAALTNLRNIVLLQTGIDMASLKYGGTAGGAAAGLHALIGAKLVNGIEYFLRLTKFSDALEGADIVITGEGTIDEQTLQGKGPFGVAVMAKEKHIPVIGLAGKVPQQLSKKMQDYFAALIAIGNGPVDLQTALSATRVNLSRTAKGIGNLINLCLIKSDKQ
jgi:glycerate kinase